jgi:hypothetical protein
MGLRAERDVATVRCELPSNNRLQQTARWQFAAPLLKRVFARP